MRHIGRINAHLVACDFIGSDFTGAIMRSAPGLPIPDFFTDDATALDWLREHAT